MCAAAVIISRCWVDAHALVQLSVQQKYDFQNIEKYGVLGGKKYCRKTWDLLSSRAAAARWRGGDGCSLPATHQIGPSTISNISGNSWDLFINVLRVFWTLTLHWGRRFAPPSCARLDCRHCSCRSRLGRQGFLGASFGSLLGSSRVWGSHVLTSDLYAGQRQNNRKSGFITDLRCVVFLSFFVSYFLLPHNIFVQRMCHNMCSIAQKAKTC